ncbi:MAG: DUF1595 domain-containing protein, partial [Myxococcota bacterium]
MALKTTTTGAVLGVVLALCPLGCGPGGRGSGQPGGEGGESGGGAEVPADELGAPSTATRRLSRREVDRIIMDVFGMEGVGSTYLPQDVFAPFDTDAESKLPSAVFVDGHEALAEHVATEVSRNAEHVGTLAGCGDANAACLRQLVQRLGRRLWRRPLDEDEVDALATAASDLATEEGSFAVGVRVAIGALLLSPEFIYVTQVGVEHDAGDRTLTPYELGTRLSLLILGTTPDDALLDRLDGDTLSDEALIELAQMLLDQRAAQAADQLVDFHTMWLGVGAPRVPAEFAQAASQETESLLRHVLVEQREPWSQLFLYPRTHVTAELAEFAGLPAPPG